MANPLRKYIWLLNKLAGQELTLKEIQDAWADSHPDEPALSSRTFHNIRNTVEDIFGINIECRNKPNYRYYIENIEALNSGINNWLLDNASILDTIQSAKGISKYLILEEKPTYPELFDLASQAIVNNNKIKVVVKNPRAHKYGETDTLRLTVDPYFLRQYNGYWSLIGYLETAPAEDSYNFPIFVESFENIVNIWPLDTTFKRTRDAEIREYVMQTLGNDHPFDYEPQDVELRVNKEAFKYLKARPIHPSQAEIYEDETDDFYPHVRHHLVIDSAFVSEILSWGDDVEVLKPLELRNYVERITLKSASQYLDQEIALKPNLFNDSWDENDELYDKLEI